MPVFKIFFFTFVPRGGGENCNCNKLFNVVPKLTDEVEWEGAVLEALLDPGALDVGVVGLLLPAPVVPGFKHKKVAWKYIFIYCRVIMHLWYKHFITLNTIYKRYTYIQWRFFVDEENIYKKVQLGKGSRKKNMFLIDFFCNCKCNYDTSMSLH